MRYGSRVEGKELIGGFVKLSHEKLFGNKDLCDFIKKELVKNLNKTHKNLEKIMEVKKTRKEIGGPLEEYCTYGVKAYGERRFNLRYLSYLIFKTKIKAMARISKAYQNYHGIW